MFLAIGLAHSAGAGVLALTGALAVSSLAVAEPTVSEPKPTIVLISGAFEESASWSEVITELNRNGFDAIAVANSRRGVARDASAISSVLRTLRGPVVLVGHSYNGPVIAEAANDKANVRALVYVAAFAPDTAGRAVPAKSPGSTAGDFRTSVPLPDGGSAHYIQQEQSHAGFPADAEEVQALLMAATQRSALSDTPGVASWRRLPSYMIYGAEDRNSPPAVMNLMVKRANGLKLVAIPGASHALMISHPHAVASIIEAVSGAMVRSW
jgi:pimeloyl-ACP methyl ester carboxylesterase